MTRARDLSKLLGGTTPTLTVGSAGTEDTKLVFDGNAQDYHIGLDDSSDSLVIGKGTALGTTPAFTIDSNVYVQQNNLPFLFLQGNDLNSRTLPNDGKFFNTNVGSQQAGLIVGSSSITTAGSNAITYNSGTGAFTVPVTGKYYIEGRFRYASTGDEAVAVVINTNDNHDCAYLILQCTEATGLHISTVANLAANDFITFRHNSGGDRIFFMATTHTSASVIFLG